MRQRVFESRNAVLRQFAATLAVFSLVLLASLGGASAQSGSPAPDQGKQPAAQATDAAKDANQNQNQKRIDEFAEAARTINGPGGNPECVWLGRRAVQLMYRDDLDTAFRHIDLYDRFGCPGGHIQAAFRCLTRFLTQIDDKVPNSLNNLTQACWINPAAQPQQAAAAASQPSASASGTPAPQPAASPSPAASPTPAAPSK